MSYKAHQINAYSHAGEYPYVEYAVQETTKSWLKKHSTDSQLILYHYTNGDGLKGIIESRSMWCTYINVLNDPLEFQYGKKLIEERIDIFIGREKDEKIKKALKEIKKFPSYVENTHKIFIASFCEDDNLLSQWRGYSERGVGYNLGFIFNSETQYIVKEGNPNLIQLINLRKIIYNEKDQIEIIDEYLSNIVEGLKKYFGEEGLYKIEEPKYDYAPISILTSNLLIEMMISMKSPKFKEENEWRLLRIVLDSDVYEITKYRLINNELIPYLDTSVFNMEKGIKKFPIEFIKIGPMLEKANNIKIIKMFIKTEAKSKKQIKVNEGIFIDHAGYALRR